MDRRTFLRCGASAVAMGGLGVGRPIIGSESFGVEEASFPAPTFAVIPVVGDGKWIWKDPPADQTGYLEPRQFDVSIGIQLQGTGNATNVKATTAVPIGLPEQQIDDVRIETQGCAADLRQLAREAGQLILAAPSIVSGQTIGAIAHFRLTLSKEYHGYKKDQFPAEQEFAKDFRKLYMYDSPGIQTRQPIVRDLAAEVGGQIEHPWDKAKAFHKWVWENIEGRHQRYTSVVEAIKNRIGDCEERAATFTALCRASGIPARLVWVPNHNWAEFYLKDRDGKGRWIPSHTSAYSWFGFTGAHEMVLQKGDSIQVPEKKKAQRLMADWAQWLGAKPKMRYYGEMKPIASNTGEDPGPGARSKDEIGRWARVDNHPLEKFTRE